MPKKAVIALEDGTIFEGEYFGVEGEVFGEAVFYTGVVGYQEVLTDPAYKDQLIVMTYPLIGNYGVNSKDNESGSTYAKALVIKELSGIYSNWMAEGSLEDFMKKQGVTGIQGIDTRALTLHLRDNGEMWGCVSTKDFDPQILINRIKEAKAKKEKVPVKNVSVQKTRMVRTKAKNPKKVALIDLGITNSLLASLAEAGYEIVQVPCDTTAEDIISLKPSAILLSPGPGSPDELDGVVSEVKKLVGKKPLFGIALGSLVLAKALGCGIKKLKCGHHGVNVPVKEEKTQKCSITAQNHSYVIDDGRLGSGVEVSYVNLNDKSIEGFRCNKKAAGIQYIPINFDELKRLVK